MGYLKLSAVITAYVFAFLVIVNFAIYGMIWLIFQLMNSLGHLAALTLVWAVLAVILGLTLARKGVLK